jgi:hydrogenase-4 component B
MKRRRDEGRGQKAEGRSGLRGWVVLVQSTHFCFLLFAFCFFHFCFLLSAFCFPAGGRVSIALVVTSIALLAISGVPSLLSRTRAGEWASSITVLAAAALGLAGAADVLTHGQGVTGAWPWHLPGAMLAVRIDPLAAAFLLPIFILGACAAVYALDYAPGQARVRCFLGLLGAGMAGVVVSAHAMLFLVAWETMAVAAFFLIATNDEDDEVRGAAWMYLIATHVGTMALLAMFTLLRTARGTFLLGPVAAPAAMTAAIFLLALAGFGFKAGVMPLHFWLPGAHANAPSHVSALLSGAMLKVGIYGLMRTLSFFASPPAWWGVVLLVIGLASAVIALALAVGQSDLKRALAYSSIENVGIIVTALGVAVVGRATAHPLWVALGMGAAILHVWNHSLFKGLLFLAAGSVLHGTHRRRIDELGGLLHRMPVTGTAFIAGAAAAAALPGANAFLSEALLYLGFFEAARDSSAVALGAAVTALAGALAVVCFIRLAGVVFLGAPRTEAAQHAMEAGWAMRLPLVVLAVACIAPSVWPLLLLRPLGAVLGDATAASALAPFANPLRVTALAAIGMTALLLLRARRSPRVTTWDCGYAAPSTRMQYTGRSIGEWLTERLTPRFFRPTLAVTEPRGLFPANATLAVRVDEPFADRVFLPLAHRWARRAARLRWVQQGRLPLYLLYIFMTLLAAIAWSVASPLLEALR